MIVSLSEVAMTVRQNCERLAENDYEVQEFTDLELGGMCAVASFALYQSFRSFNLNPTLIEGRYDESTLLRARYCELHCWVVVKNDIYDITASQFGVVDKVHITNINDGR